MNTCRKIWRTRAVSWIVMAGSIFIGGIRSADADTITMKCKSESYPSYPPTFYLLDYTNRTVSLLPNGFSAPITITEQAISWDYDGPSGHWTYSLDRNSGRLTERRSRTGIGDYEQSLCEQQQKRF